jgi:hypothetical protein
MDNESTALSRRKLVALSAAGGAAALMGAGSTAQAAPVGTGPTANRAMKADGTDGEPSSPRIGSAAIGGYTYIHRSFSDFYPVYGGAITWTPYGVWGSSSNSELVATCDLPPGAFVRDIEWYFSSTVTGTLGGAWLWTTGSASFTPIALTSVTGTASAGLRAQRTVVPSGTYGPYANGARLMLDVYTNANRVINGVRVGYTQMPAGAVMLAAPLRVYDSRSGAKIGNGQTRIHSLASWIPAGATAAIVNMHITSGEHSGGLAVYNTGSSLPAGHSLYWSGLTTAHEMHVKLPSDRKIKVTARGVTGFKTHYMIDVVGYIA